MANPREGALGMRVPLLTQFLSVSCSFLGWGNWPKNTFVPPPLKLLPPGKFWMRHFKQMTWNPHEISSIFIFWSCNFVIFFRFCLVSVASRVSSPLFVARKLRISFLCRKQLHQLLLEIYMIIN